MPIAFGLFLGQFIGGMVVSLILIMAVRKVKQGTSISQIYDRAYWLLPTRVFNFKNTPGSELRELAG